MDDPFAHLRPHRRLVAFLETGLDCLEEALRIDATLGVLPHWSRTHLRTMADELAELFDHLERAAPHVLGPLREQELLDEDNDDEEQHV